MKRAEPISRLLLQLAIVLSLSIFAGPFAPAQPEDSEPSLAERIARLERSIEKDKEELQKVRDELAKQKEPNSEYEQAEQAFDAVDEALTKKQEELQQLVSKGDEKAAAKVREEIEPLEEKKRLAEERFDLAIAYRTTLRENVAALERKVLRDKQELAKLLGEDVVITIPADHALAPEATPSETAVTPGPQATPSTDGSASVAAVAPVPSPTTTPADPTPTPADAVKNEEGDDEAQEKDEVIVEAKAEAAQREEQARVAQESAKSITERLDAIRADIQTERKTLETLRNQAENTKKTKKSLEEQLKKLRENRGNILDLGNREEIHTTERQIDEAEQRFAKQQADVLKKTERINDLHTQLSDLQNEQNVALSKAKQKSQEAEVAQKRLASLENPFHPRNILRWLQFHGIKIVLIILGVFVILTIASIVSRRVVKLIARKSDDHVDDAEIEMRAQTLVSVIHNLVKLVTWIAAVIMILEEVGVPVAPLLGGAAIGGLAVAFGAQNLVRDFFTGFTILIENQYTVNDVIKICGIAGSVERITLRVTVLRDLEGTLHFIPNGQITTVSNMTHGWSRVVIDAGVGYGEDVDRVITIIKEIGRELREDPLFKRDIIEDLTMFGVDSMQDSSVNIKFVIKTRPWKQWGIKREMLRRIKVRFDEEGIEIPFPQRTIHHRYTLPAPPDFSNGQAPGGPVPPDSTDIGVD